MIFILDMFSRLCLTLHQKVSYISQMFADVLSYILTPGSTVDAAHLTYPTGHQAGVLRALWEADQIWQDIPEVSRLQGGRAPRVSGALRSALHSQPDRHAGEERRGV